MNPGGSSTNCVHLYFDCQHKHIFLMTIMPFPALSSSQQSSSRHQSEADAALPFCGRLEPNDRTPEVTNLEDPAHGSLLSHNTSFFSVPSLTSFTAEGDAADEEDEWTEEEVSSDEEEGDEYEDEEETVYDEVSLYEEVVVSDEEDEVDDDEDQEGDEVDFSQSIHSMTIQPLLDPVPSAAVEAINDVTCNHQDTSQPFCYQKTTMVSPEEDESTEMDLTESERTEVTNEDLHPLIQVDGLVQAEAFITTNHQENLDVEREQQEESALKLERVRVDEVGPGHINQEELLPVSAVRVDEYQAGSKNEKCQGIERENLNKTLEEVLVETNFALETVNEQQQVEAQQIEGKEESMALAEIIKKFSKKEQKCHRFQKNKPTFVAEEAEPAPKRDTSTEMDLTDSKLAGKNLSPCVEERTSVRVNTENVVAHESEEENEKCQGISAASLAEISTMVKLEEKLPLDAAMKGQVEGKKEPSESAEHFETLAKKDQSCNLFWRSKPILVAEKSKPLEKEEDADEVDLPEPKRKEPASKDSRSCSEAITSGRDEVFNKKDQQEEELQTEGHQVFARKEETSRAKQKRECLITPDKELPASAEFLVLTKEKSQNCPGNTTPPAVKPHPIEPLDKDRPRKTRARQSKTEKNIAMGSERFQKQKIEEKNKKCQDIDAAFQAENLNLDRIQKKKALGKRERIAKINKERTTPDSVGDQKSSKTDQTNKRQTAGVAHVVTEPVTTIPMELPYHTTTKTSRSGERDRVRYRTSSRRSAAFKPGL